MFFHLRLDRSRREGRCIGDHKPLTDEYCNLSSRICPVLTRVGSVSIKIAIPRIEPQRILAHPPPRRRVVPAGPVVLQVRFDIELPPGPRVAAAVGRVRLADDVAEGVVVDRVLDVAAVVDHVEGSGTFRILFHIPGEDRGQQGPGRSREPDDFRKKNPECPRSWPRS